MISMITKGFLHAPTITDRLKVTMKVQSEVIPMPQIEAIEGVPQIAIE